MPVLVAATMNAASAAAAATVVPSENDEDFVNGNSLDMRRISITPGEGRKVGRSEGLRVGRLAAPKR
jgi:hypothetical protein